MNNISHREKQRQNPKLLDGSSIFFFLPPPPHFVFWSLKRGRKSRLYAVYEDFRVPPWGFCVTPPLFPEAARDSFT
ncbi:hypothetical protein CEXT_394211 [Caerostris extrusa]|uniref:Uncharacterized protein n=1 Tax=Caerostris extrusa TaxID=172846 RepID=A0AAV4QBR3_CAEEX|nr:hypothetical protein CEXT_394211 [Caerostris extrusa]